MAKLSQPYKTHNQRHIDDRHPTQGTGQCCQMLGKIPKASGLESRFATFFSLWDFLKNKSIFLKFLSDLNVVFNYQRVNLLKCDNK